MSANAPGNYYVRSFPYPVLEEGNMSFDIGLYTVDLTDVTSPQNKEIKKVRAEHRIENAGLISRMLDNRTFAYGCAVASPLTGYRKFFSSDDANQEIFWHGDAVLGSIVFSPIIFCQKSVSNYVLSRDDGVCDFWIGKSVNFQVGAKVAISSPYTMSSSLHSLLRFCANESLSPGQIHARICADTNFRFDIDINPDIYRLICNPRGENELSLKRAVIINAMTACFSLLAKNYGDIDNDLSDYSSWEEIPNLVTLSAEVKSLDLPLWDEDGFSPEKTATAIYPYTIPMISDAHDSE
ncbi:MAG: hypothetical protein OXE47_06690 [Gammaproteobacteria bacterium]|nr:hypothetical protein [Gammaproteobacteria bacterium]